MTRQYFGFFRYCVRPNHISNDFRIIPIQNIGKNARGHLPKE